MKNIIKSQLFQLRKNKYIPIVMIVIMVVAGLLAFLVSGTSMGISESETNLSSTDHYIGCNLYSTVYFIMVIPFLAVGLICGSDFTDKTINYELMQGHSRGQIYFGRAIIAIAASFLAAFLMLASSVITNTIFYGWGTQISVFDAVWRLLMFALPVFRLTCLAIFLTAVVKKMIVTIISGYVYMIFTSVITVVITDVDSPIFTIGCMQRLLDFKMHNSFGLSGELHLTYDPMFTAGELAVLFASCIGVGALYLIMGYVFFKNDDLN